jgi:hypothetical protein
MVELNQQVNQQQNQVTPNQPGQLTDSGRTQEDQVTQLSNELQSEPKNLNTNTKTQSQFNETKQLEGDVEFKPTTNVYEEKLQQINNSDQDRIKKLRQTELLKNLRNQRLDQARPSDGKTYSRSLDEAVIMNTTTKDIGLGRVKEDSRPERLDVVRTDNLAEEDGDNSIKASEDFEEGFLSDANRDLSKKFHNQGDYGQKNEDEDDQEEDNDPDDEEEQNKSKVETLELEEDELLDLDFDINKLDVILDKVGGYEENKSPKVDLNEIEERILGVSEKLDKKDGSTNALTREIEKRIKKVSLFIDKKETPSGATIEKINKTKLSVPKSQRVNKLRKRFKGG